MMKYIDKVQSTQVNLPYENTKEYYIELEEVEEKTVYNIVKRCFDFLVSLVALLVLLVPMCIIAVIIRCTSKGPAIYTQDRLGMNGKAFKVIKFRTMCVDAEEYGAQWCKEDDPRVTKIGKFLRRYHIDELPQLLNILVGDMSFIGPRPERKCFHDAFESYIHGFSARLKVKPGLTGLAQIAGGSLMPPEEKIKYDVDYIKRRSFSLDIKIIFKTIETVITRRYTSI